MRKPITAALSTFTAALRRKDTCHDPSSAHDQP